MPSSLLIAVLGLSAGQVELDQKAQSAVRLKFMKETAARIEIRREGDGAADAAPRAQQACALNGKCAAIFGIFDVYGLSASRILGDDVPPTAHWRNVTDTCGLLRYPVDPRFRKSRPHACHRIAGNSSSGLR